MREFYKDTRFHPRSKKLIEICDDIITEYANQGHRMTVRQVFYQLVARKVTVNGKVFENTIQNYDNLVALLTNARLAGLIDWDAIEDRTRDVLYQSHWYGVKQMLKSAATWYHEHMWDDQPYRVFGIVEKEALAGVMEHILKEWDVPLLPARGYPSATTLRELAKDRIMSASQEIVVLHFGDHDPSGLDMTRDLIERLELFTRGRDIDFRRVALNIDQVRELNPPPNPAKTTDGRYEKYRAEFGTLSWELDSLPPTYLRELARSHIEPLIDWDEWNETLARTERRRAVLTRLYDEYDSNDGTDIPVTE